MRPDRNSLFSVLLNSRANSTATKYINEIKKFFVWCRSRQISVQIPFSAPAVALYLFNLDQQLRSPPQWCWSVPRLNGYILSHLRMALILWTTPAAEA